MIQVEGIFSGGGSDISAPIIGKHFNWTGGDGTYQVLEDGDGNWRIKFLASGIFTPLQDMVIDAFLVGGGGGGQNGASYQTNRNGGGGGYTKTITSVVLTKNTPYTITVGDGGYGGGTTSGKYAGSDGGSSNAFGSTADGGKSPTSGSGGAGGSGGGGYTYHSSYSSGKGGSDGSNGTTPSGSYGTGGAGQGTTTREFGEASGDLYAGGGGGGGRTVGASGGSGGGGYGYDPSTGRTTQIQLCGETNTGGGGGGGGWVSSGAGNGGSGIVIIRKHKEATA